jgi:hypothetical protein
METILAFISTSTFWVVAIPIGLILVYIIKKYWTGYEDDNAAEQFCERVIKDKTGIKVDLTPSSPEPEVKV